MEPYPPRAIGSEGYLVPREVLDEADRLVGYWERHGDSAEAVDRWAVSDLLGFVRYFAELD